MKKINLIINSVIGAILLLFVGLSIWQFNISENLKKQLSQKEENFKQSHNVSRHLETLEKQVKILKQQEEKLNDQVPFGEAKPFELIKKLMDISRAAGLNKVVFNVGKTSSSGPQMDEQGMQGGQAVSSMNMSGQPQEEAATSQQGSAGQAEANAPRPIYLEMTFEATLPQYQAFVEKVTKMERIITIDQINIERDEKIVPYQKIKLVLAVYTF